MKDDSTDAESVTKSNATGTRVTYSSTDGYLWTFCRPSLGSILEQGRKVHTCFGKRALESCRQVDHQR